VTSVVDGDTVDVSNGERIRIIGIDTPERGECGYPRPTTTSPPSSPERPSPSYPVPETTVTPTTGSCVTSTPPMASTSAYRSSRPSGAISRYDARDGYGRHDREDIYVAADQRMIAGCSTIPGQPSSTTQVPPGGGGGSCDPK